MKCLKCKDEYRKVTDVEAMAMARNGWTYCKKTEYKAKTRPAKVEKKVEKAEKVEKSSAKKERGYSKYREKMANN